MWADEEMVNQVLDLQRRFFLVSTMLIVNHYESSSCMAQAELRAQ
jgi:hypothetical protein